MDLENMFNYHPPEPDQIARYEAIRAGAKVFAAIILENTPKVSGSNSVDSESAGSCRRIRRAREKKGNYILKVPWRKQNDDDYS